LVVDVSALMLYCWKALEYPVLFVDIFIPVQLTRHWA